MMMILFGAGGAVLLIGLKEKYGK